ncbi:Flp family type IVb pilin [Amaricoccus macauensis]|uniref:Flp family type IVb pilin n=1 Tax=Amaricoccus macauensis TaxID=57001 RepID=UPI003C7BF3B7
MKMLRFASRLWKDEEGATAIEYGLLAALISVAIIGAVTTLGDQLNTTIDTIATDLEEANTADDEDDDG